MLEDPHELVHSPRLAPYPHGRTIPTPQDVIRAWLLLNRYTVADAARVLGLAPRTVADVLNGDTPGRLSTAQAFKLAGVALDDWPLVVR